MEALEGRKDGSTIYRYAGKNSFGSPKIRQFIKLASDFYWYHAKHLHSGPTVTTCRNFSGNI